MSRQSIWFLLFVPLVLMIVWFRSGNILATAEGGIPFNNLENHAQITKYAWADPALGNSTGIVTASHPTYVFLSFFERIGVPGFLIEAWFFYLLFISSGFGIYFFTKLLFPDLPGRYIILTVIFYWFNPFAMVNIWHRFLYNFMVFYSFLPIVSYFYLKGIVNQKIGYAFVVALLSVGFSYSLTSTPFNFLLWMVLLYISFFYFITETQLKTRIFIIKLFLCSGLLYLLVNAWWLSQLISFVRSSSFETTVNSFFSQEGNRDTLDILSSKLGKFVNTIRLFHGDFFSSRGYGWVETYTKLPFTLFSFLFPLIGLSTIYFRRNKSVLLLAGLFVIGLFLAKGNNPPFGELFEYFFTTFPFLQIFRNPFEKFGFLLPLSLSPLIAYGIFVFINNKPFERVIFLVSLLLLTVYYGFAFFTGSVFNIDTEKISFQNNYEVKVPGYYQQMDEFMNGDGTLFRFMMMPMDGEGITQNWDKGYSGIEASSTLFKKSAVSFNTTVPYFYEITKNIQEQFFTNNRFLEIANRLNIKYFVVRDDIDYLTRGMFDPKIVDDDLKGKPEDFMEKIDFGELTLWENKSYVDNFSILSNFVVSSNIPTDLADLTFQEASSTAVLMDEKVSSNLGVVPDVLINNPNRVYFFPRVSQEGYVHNQNLFPFISIAPGSSWYPVLLNKEKIEVASMPMGEKKLSQELFYLGKRLSEMHSIQENNDSILQFNILDKYKKQFEQFKQDYRLLKMRNPVLLRQWDEWGRALIRHHELYLEDISNTAEGPVKFSSMIISDDIKQFVRVGGIMPQFLLIDTPDFPIKNRRVFQFSVSKPGEYELIVPSSGKLDDNRLNTRVQLDNVIFQRDVSRREDGVYSFGKFVLEKGDHEVGVNDLLLPLQISQADAYGSTVFSIPDFDPYSNYLLTYDVKSDFNDLVKAVFKNYSINKLIDSSEALRDEKANKSLTHVEVTFAPSPQSTKGEVIFWFPKNIGSIKDASHINISKVIPVLPKLIARKSTKPTIFKQIGVKKINPTQYELEIPETKENTVITFSQLYNSGWILTDEKKSIISKHFLVNGFANGWVLPPGEKRLLIALYQPQVLLQQAEKLSVAGILFCLAGGGYLIWKRKM